MSGTDWWDRWDEIVEDAEQEDAKISAWLDGDDDDTPADDNKATDSKSAAESKPDTPEPKPNVPTGRPDFSKVDGAKSLDEAIALTNDAISASRPKPEPEAQRSPEEQRAAIDQALEGATSLDDAVARLAKAGLAAEKGSQL